VYNIIFVGAPGAGKGTQAIKVAEALGLIQVASGDIFRQNIEEKTSLGQLVQSYMAKGELVPDEVTIDMVLERMYRNDVTKGVILDGFPRNLHQATELDEALAKRNEAISKAVCIDVREEELVNRLSSRRVCRLCQAAHSVGDKKCLRCGGELYQREDDTAQTIKHRLEVYFKQTAPVIDYYHQQGKLIKVDGSGDVDKITKKIVNALK